MMRRNKARGGRGMGWWRRRGNEGKHATRTWEAGEEEERSGMERDLFGRERKEEELEEWNRERGKRRKRVVKRTSFGEEGKVLLAVMVVMSDEYGGRDIKWL